MFLLYVLFGTWLFVLGLIESKFASKLAFLMMALFSFGRIFSKGAGPAYVVMIHSMFWVAVVILISTYLLERKAERKRLKR